MVQRAVPRLDRRRHSREPKRRFILFCEGKKTEPAYFNALRHAYSDTLIEVEIVGEVGVAYTVATSAVERARSLGLALRSRKRLNFFEKYDKVWAIFDRDEHPKFDEAVEICRSSGVGCARSNPCFEVWLILHEEEFNKPDDRKAVQARLQKLRPEYRKSGAKVPDCAELVKRVEAAEKRAKEQLGRRVAEGKPYGRPSTTVGLLTGAIRSAASNVGAPAGAQAQTRAE